MGTTKQTLIAGALGTALVLGGGIKDGKAEKINNSIDNTKAGVSEVLKHDPMKQLGVDLSKGLTEKVILDGTRQDLLLAKLDIKKTNSKYTEFINELGDDEDVGKFNKLNETQKEFALKIYLAGKNDPVLLQEKSNGWLARNCVLLMERINTLEKLIRTGILEKGKGTDLGDRLELVFEYAPNIQKVLTVEKVKGLKEIEAQAYVVALDNENEAKKKLTESEKKLTESEKKLTESEKKLDKTNKQYERLQRLKALLVSGI